jgi:heat shock protein HslJ
MKTNKLGLITIVITILCTLLIGFFITVSCEKPTVPNTPQSDDPALLTTKDSTATNLAGTKWKLVKFVNVSEGITKDPEPSSDSCYWIMFNNDGTMCGQSSTNELFGYYQINFSTLTIQLLVGGTKISEMFDGSLYMEKINLVDSFNLTNTDLKMYYNNQQNYLLFKSLDK